MEQTEIKEMSKKRILETLIELKHEAFDRPLSKYFFALGHAIRFIENTKDSDQDKSEINDRTHDDYEDDWGSLYKWE